MEQNFTAEDAEYAEDLTINNSAPSACSAVDFYNNWKSGLVNWDDKV